MNKLKYIFVSLISTTVFSSEINEFREFIRGFEGYTNRPVYKINEVVIGIGHNLIHTPNIKSYYSNLDIERFYRADYAAAIDCARRNITDFDSLPKEIRYVTLSIIWTVGRTGFSRWKEYRTALNYKNYALAGTALYHSPKWRSQVGPNRFGHHYRVLKNTK